MSIAKRTPDFPFNIVDCINALGITASKFKGDKMYIDCPVCIANGKKADGRCEVVVSNGWYSCSHCGIYKGGILDLYCYHRNCDKKTANKELRAFVNAPTYNKAETKQMITKAQKNNVKESELAKREEIDRTYRAFLSLCELAPEHKANLINRGLTEKNIAHFGFKTTPVNANERRNIITALQKQGCVLEGVPGFYVNKYGNWDICTYSKNRGILIPMTNLQNELLGFQIRLDNPTSKKKYAWLSSNNMEKGVGRTSVPHITNAFNVSESIYITEGGLKADIASVLGKRTFIAIAGVTQFKVIPIIFVQLKKNGVKKIIDSFDMDSDSNTSVENARQKIKQYALEAGLEYFRLEWDSQHKGIDDYLKAVPKGQRKFIIKE